MNPAIIIAAVAAIPGVLAAVVQYRNRSTNPKENGQDWVVHHYQKIAQDATERAELEAVRAGNEAARADLYEAAYRQVSSAPDDALPMHRFVDDGFLHELNKTLEADGARVCFFLDDQRQKFALGYYLEPIENDTADRLPSPAVAEQRSNRLKQVLTEMRDSHGLGNDTTKEEG